jgi:hypothetical protein
MHYLDSTFLRNQIPVTFIIDGGQEFCNIFVPYFLVIGYAHFESNSGEFERTFKYYLKKGGELGWSVKNSFVFCWIISDVSF